jgi:DNA polymerase-1
MTELSSLAANPDHFNPDDESGAPAPARTLADIWVIPSIIYCTMATQAEELIREMIADAAGRPVALDIETAALPEEAQRLKDANLRMAALNGELKAATQAKAPADQIAALKEEKKYIEARVKYLQTAALDPHRSTPRLVQIFGGGDRLAVIDVFRTGVGVLQLLAGADVVTHHVGFDLSFFAALGVEFGVVHCTMQAVILTLGVRAASLEDAVKIHLGVELNKSAQTSGWGVAHLTVEQIRYAALDVLAVWLLARRVFPVLGAQTPAYEIAVGVTPAVARMKSRGLLLDLDEHAALMRSLKDERVETCEAYKSACVRMGKPELAAKVPKTPKEIRTALEALLTSEELAKWQRTEKTNALSTARADLRRAAHYPPVVEIVTLSRIDKLLSGFGPTLRALVNPMTGRIHANYRAAGTASGRATCSYPNLQQAPSAKSNKNFRASFIAADGFDFVAGDFSSMELRAGAHISGDRRMIDAFRRGIDLHLLTASHMVAKLIEEVTPEERDYAKPINFGAIFGQGAPGLVRSAWKTYQLVITDDEARRWLAAFNETYPDFDRWRRVHASKCIAADRIVIGRNAAIVGRIFPYARLRSGRSKFTAACNYPIQGGCADASMLALEMIDRMLFEENIDGGPVLWVHDEIVLEVPKAHAGRAKTLLEYAMTEAFEETFPGSREMGLLNNLVKARIGPNWASVK